MIETFTDKPACGKDNKRVAFRKRIQTRDNEGPLLYGHSAMEYEKIRDRWLEQCTQDRNVLAAFSEDNDFTAFPEGIDNIGTNTEVSRFIL